MLITKTASCDTIYSWAKKNGYVVSYTKDPKIGDLVLFDFGGNHSRNQHVGICASWSGNSGTFWEGNTSLASNDNGGAVMLRTRYRASIKCFIRVPYTKTQTAAKLVAIAAAEKGVTEYPANSNKVKYNTWYYGSAVSGSDYPWCAVFVCWCFAVLAGEIKVDAKPVIKTVKVDMPMLKEGAEGVAVRHLQLLLKSYGYYSGTIDGEFGKKTTAAVKAYQIAVGFTGDDVDGVVGALTWTKLWAV